MAKRNDRRTRNTQALIDAFRRRSEEFSRLQGVLCAAHGFDDTARAAYDRLIDGVMIAERMDELNREVLAEIAPLLASARP